MRRHTVKTGADRAHRGRTPRQCVSDYGMHRDAPDIRAIGFVVDLAWLNFVGTIRFAPTSDLLRSLERGRQRGD